MFPLVLSGEPIRVSIISLIEFKFMELANTVGNWQAEHRPIGPVICEGMDLVRAALEERFKSLDRATWLLNRHCIDSGRLRSVMRRSCQ
jgi:hypothetical protein